VNSDLFKMLILEVIKSGKLKKNSCRTILVIISKH